MAKSERILMPTGTAVWLVDNTSLTFEQIANFLNIHVLEVKAIADGDVAVGILGVDPIVNNLLTRDEITRCEADTSAQLELVEAAVVAVNKRRGKKYTPISRRIDKPDAIAWLLRHHPNLTENQISRLVGTTRNMTRSVGTRSHWNYANIRARSPVELQLCTQEELDTEVERANKNAPLPQTTNEDGDVLFADASILSEGDISAESQPDIPFATTDTHTQDEHS